MKKKTTKKERFIIQVSNAMGYITEKEYNKLTPRQKDYHSPFITIEGKVYKIVKIEGDKFDVEREEK